MWLLLLLAMTATQTTGYTGGDDKFIKKYAMMKVYESCFGPEVVREVRQEMRAASAKCATGGANSEPPPPPMMPHRTHSRPHPPSQGVVDSSRLQQALLAVLNRQAAGGSQSGFGTAPAPHYRHPSPSYSAPAYASPSSGLAELLSQYQPGPSPGVYQAMPQLDPVQALQALQAVSQYQQQQQQPAKTHIYQPFYQHGLSGFSGRQRYSRDLDVQGQLETLTSRMSGRVKNVTCVMQELGYLDSNLEPDFERISERISRLPVPVELRRDMMEGVQFCKQFSQCIPEARRDKFLLSGELLRPMFFFRCYKHKKLEACIMKDVRERYAQVDVGQDGLDDNLLPGAAAMRSLEKDKTLSDDTMAAAVYEFLYGGDNLNLDNDSLL